jgi:hypothetical protein
MKKHRNAFGKAKAYMLFKSIEGQEFDLAEVAGMFAEGEENQSKLLTLLEKYTSPGGNFEDELKFTRWMVDNWRK